MERVGVSLNVSGLASSPSVVEEPPLGGTGAPRLHTVMFVVLVSAGAGLLLLRTGLLLQGKNCRFRREDSSSARMTHKASLPPHDPEERTRVLALLALIQDDGGQTLHQPHTFYELDDISIDS